MTRRTPERLRRIINYEEGRTDAVAAFTAVDPEGHAIQWTLDGTDEDCLLHRQEERLLSRARRTSRTRSDRSGDDGAIAIDNTYEVTVEADDGVGTRPS